MKDKLTVYTNNPIDRQRFVIYKPTFKNKILAWYRRVFKGEKNITFKFDPDFKIN